MNDALYLIANAPSAFVVIMIRVISIGAIVLFGRMMVRHTTFVTLHRIFQHFLHA